MVNFFVLGGDILRFDASACDGYACFIHRCESSFSAGRCLSSHQHVTIVLSRSKANYLSYFWKMGLLIYDQLEICMKITWRALPGFKPCYLLKLKSSNEFGRNFFQISSILHWNFIDFHVKFVLHDLVLVMFLIWNGGHPNEYGDPSWKVFKLLSLEIVTF